MKRTPNDIPATVEEKDGWTVYKLHPGNLVFCDLCSEDYTERTEAGGFLFGSKAVCPGCAPRFRKDVDGYGESHYIKGECPAGMSFADWIRGMR